MSRNLRIYVLNTVECLVIIFIPVILVSDNLDEIGSKNILLLILLAIYPFYNLIVGCLIYKFRTPLIVTLVVSAISYIAVFYRYYNDSAYVYLLLYAGLAILSYSTLYVVGRRKLKIEAENL